ncbi:MAG TPA: hypothetical protein VMH00_00645 [Candidatus Limnocylindrales bacterium]|nr:hypothetical protein [Candidatus Limnocylindrales bacterium]
MSAPPRPIWPHPRRFYPFPYGGYGGFGYGFYPGWGLGFGFPFFGLGYWDWGYSYSTNSNLPPQASQPTMILYLTDGSAYEVTDYWVTGDTLNYVTDGGKRGAISLRDLDLRRTIDANARLGMKFSLDRTARGRPLDRIEPSTQNTPPPQP